MLTGAHMIIYSKDSQADVAFFRDVLKLTNVDVGRGWLIFKLPPSELAVHPLTDTEKHEIFLMTDDIAAFMMEMTVHGITCGPLQDERWGLLTSLTLPGGGTIGVYQPKHARP